MQRVLRSEQPKPVTTFQEYPKAMILPPDFQRPMRPATPFEVQMGDGRPRPNENYTILAIDREHEAELVAQGFVSPGRGDPDAFMNAQATKGHVHSVVEYPKALTPPGGGPQVFVNNAKQERAFRASWGEAMPEPAAAEKQVDESERPAPVRLALPAPEPVRTEPLSAADRMKAARERKRAGIVQASGVDVPPAALDALVRANLLPAAMRGDARHIAAALAAVAARLPDLLKF